MQPTALTNSYRSGPTAHPRTGISLRQVSKIYAGAAGATRALADVSFDITAGEFVAIVGRSGSGKSTLVNLLTGIDAPTSGSIVVDATALNRLDAAALARWRGLTVGIVFQFFQLLPTLTVAENVMLPMDFCHTSPPGLRRGRAVALLSDLGIADKVDELPASLSGGQQQRAAIARALANDPPVIVADEPTGNLDSRTAEAVLTYFAALARTGKTVVMATHERDLERHGVREIVLEDGVVAADGAVAGRDRR